MSAEIRVRSACAPNAPSATARKPPIPPRSSKVRAIPGLPFHTQRPLPPASSGGNAEGNSTAEERNVEKKFRISDHWAPQLVSRSHSGRANACGVYGGEVRQR